jgi:hypothetical protein
MSSEYGCAIEASPYIYLSAYQPLTPTVLLPPADTVPSAGPNGPGTTEVDTCVVLVGVLAEADDRVNRYTTPPPIKSHSQAGIFIAFS